MNKFIYIYIIIRNIIKYAFYTPKKYFHGYEKQRITIFFELLIHFFRNGEFNSYYYAYGLNMRGTQPINYYSKKKIIYIISFYNNRIREKYGIPEKIDCDIITKDKFYLTSLLYSNNIPVIQNISLITNGKIIKSNGNEYNLDKLFDIEYPIIIKNTILEYNEGFMLIDKIEKDYFLNGNRIKNKEHLFQILSYGNWVVQRVFQSSSQIRKINDTALNTTRIVTIYAANGSEYLAGYQAFATNGQKTDHWGHGSVYVGFNHETEKLTKYGFFHPDYKRYGRVTKHPDSNITFEGYTVPGLAAAVDICLRAHRYLYYMFMIGWDVAITDEGPKILEANEKPGMNALQCIDGGLRNKLERIKI